MLHNATRNLNSFITKFKNYIVELLTSSIIKNFFIYSFGSFILKAFQFFLAPITLAILSPDDFGLLSLIMSFINIFIIFLGLGLRQAFSLEYFHYQKLQVPELINHLITIYCVVALPLISFLAFNSFTINKYIFFGKANPMLIFFMLIYCFLQFFVELFYQLLQYESKAFQLMMLQTTMAMLTLILNLIFLFLFKLGILSFILSLSLTMLIAFSISLKHYIKQNFYESLCLKKGLSHFVYYLKLGLPFVPSMLFAWILASGNRFFLAQYSTMHSVGIYSLADTFGTLFQMLVLYPFSNAYLPILFKKFSENKDNILLIEQWNKRNMYAVIFFLAATIYLGFLGLKSIFYWIIPATYNEALNYILFILISNIFLMATYFVSGLIQFYKKSYFLTGALCLPAIINMIGNYFLVPLFSINGCIISTLISYFCYFVITIWYNNQLCLQIKNEKNIASNSQQSIEQEG